MGDRPPVMVATRWRRSESDGPTSRCSPLPADVPVPALDGGGVIGGREDASVRAEGTGVAWGRWSAVKDGKGEADGAVVSEAAGRSTASSPGSLPTGIRPAGQAAMASAPAEVPATTRIASEIGRRRFDTETLTARRMVGAATRSGGYQAPYPP